MSRTPSKKASESNGHARLSLPGGVFRGSATNLFVSGKGGLARAALKKRLLAEVKAQGLPYGIIIRQFDDAAITSSPELSRYELVSLLQTVNRAAPPLALFAHRIYPDGREELVRGVQLEPVDMRAWRDLVAVSREKTVMNFLASVEDPFLHRLRGVGPGYVPSAGIESAIESPDLLFRELELRPSKLGRRPPPLLPRP